MFFYQFCLIKLYFYTVRYKCYIKTPGFLQNISKKSSKKIQAYIHNFFFHAYGQILKFFQAYFHKKQKQLHISHIFKKQKKDLVKMSKTLYQSFFISY
jgi:hypothetical protein